MSAGARLRVGYLAGIAVAIFLISHPVAIGALALAHVVLWLALRMPVRGLVRQVTKLAGFSALVVGSYALTSLGVDGADRWVAVPLFGLELSLNATGALEGLCMVARIFVVILASTIVRSGDPRAIVSGLRALGAPPIVALPLDAVLAVLSEGGRGQGGGGGRGSGRGRGNGNGAGRPADQIAEPGFFASLRRLVRGDAGALVQRLDRQIGHAQLYVTATEPAATRALAEDAATIAGVSATMLGFKAVKVLPSIPFAPGYKMVVLTPLYVLAARLTHARAGASLTGLTMGTAAFLLGDGRYGIFEIAKHVAPGAVVDVAIPVLTSGGRRPGLAAYCVLGAASAGGRFATTLLLTLLVQAPALAWAILLPGLTVHLAGGALSGWVTFHLLRSLERDVPDVRRPAPTPVVRHATLPEA